jgi:hypothetical protein
VILNDRSRDFEGFTRIAPPDYENVVFFSCGGRSGILMALTSKVFPGSESGGNHDLILRCVCLYILSRVMAA